jgi:hypothetical protein
MAENGTLRGVWLPAAVEREFSIEAGFQGISLSTYLRNLVTEESVRLLHKHRLDYHRFRLVSVLKTKLSQVQTVLSNYSHMQASREKSAISLVNSIFQSTSND